MIYITDTAVVRDDVDAEFEVVKAEVDAVDAEVEAPVTTTGGKHPHHFTAEQRDGDGERAAPFGHGFGDVGEDVRIRSADPEAREEPQRGEFGQIRCERRGERKRAEDEAADDDHFAAPDAIGQRAEDQRPDQEPDHADREDDAEGGAVGMPLPDDRGRDVAEHPEVVAVRQEQQHAPQDDGDLGASHLAVVDQRTDIDGSGLGHANVLLGE